MTLGASKWTPLWINFGTPVDQDLCSDLFANATARTEVDEEIRIPRKGLMRG